jgi:ABC-type Mn2+/Zn2+ transport system ATPase subunit
MPHMNRIRVVNVAFNDAKSFFDDLRMSLAGKSTTYDLENGGGKTVLLMMLLQTVIPNTSLREDKPLKNSGGRALNGLGGQQAYRTLSNFECHRFDAWESDHER